MSFKEVGKYVCPSLDRGGEVRKKLCKEVETQSVPSVWVAVTCRFNCSTVTLPLSISFSSGNDECLFNDLNRTVNAEL